MLIRSQDKTILANMDTMQGLNIEGNAKIIMWHDGKIHNTMGYYATEAKVIKALDMIQNAYEYIMTEKQYYIFQMPQDSEVEK